jgi:hypothetical protein
VTETNVFQLSQPGQRFDLRCRARRAKEISLHLRAPLRPQNGITPLRKGPIRAAPHPPTPRRRPNVRAYTFEATTFQKPRQR